MCRYRYMLRPIQTNSTTWFRLVFDIKIGTNLNQPMLANTVENIEIEVAIQDTSAQYAFNEDV